MPIARARFAFLVVMLAGLGCSRSSTPRAADAACTEGAYGVPALDALASFPFVDDEPALTHRDVAALVDDAAGRELLARLVAATRVDVTGVPVALRVVLQNDVWGLWQRLQSLDVASASREALATSAAALVVHLAAFAPDVPPVALPPALATLMRAEDGWREREVEILSLQHERLYGNRRIFRVALRGDETDAPFESVAGTSERALFSTLVALTPDLVPVRTDIVGEVEMLTFRGANLVGARVFELDRRGLRCRGPASSLHAVDGVTQVPSVGANGVLASFGAAVPLEELPCLQCHDDDGFMTLPSRTLPVGQRHVAILDVIRTDARALAPAR